MKPERLHVAGVLACQATQVGVPGQAVLATVTARLQPGRFTAVLGPNGAGKSTLLSMLCGTRAPRGGEVLLDGQPLARWGLEALARRRAVMPQDTAVAFDFTVREVVEMGRFAHRSAPSTEEGAIVEAAMAATGVAHLAERGAQWLSGGERARTHLARALAQVWLPSPDGAPRWLLLDEPTAALDLAHQHHALALLRRWAVEQGVGVVAVLHDLNLALRYAHDVLLLGAATRQAVFGEVQAVLSPETIAQVWGVECTPVLARDGVRQYLFTQEYA